jgi:hypothetical protein
MLLAAEKLKNSYEVFDGCSVDDVPHYGAS